MAVCSRCPDLAESLGLCSKHHKRWLAHGDPDVVLVRQDTRGLPLAERFEAWVDRTGECHIYQGKPRPPGGYCHLKVDGKTKKAHHVAWFLATGERPTDLVRHECDNPPCVNFDHLIEGNHAANMADKVRRGRTPDFVGHRSHRAKLTVENVQLIRAPENIHVPDAVWAERFGVVAPTIHRARRGKTWSH